MTARNCWTCRHDMLVHDGTRRAYHACGLCPSDVGDWIDRHVAPDSPGVPRSMPPRDAPPCPGWAPRGGEG